VRTFGLGLAVAVALVVGACSGDADEADAEFVTIGMLDNSYTRDLTRVGVGDTVRFANNGDTIHNAFAANGAWSTEDVSGDVAIQPGESVRVTFEEPGLYDFYCTFHATQDEDGTWRGMVATLAVGDVETTTTEGGDDVAAVAEWSGTTRRVPGDHPTIQNAVDAADPGDLVLVAPGTYREQVDVTTPSVTIRGEDRQDVVIDAEFTRNHGINVVGADGVVVENLTVRNAVVNGLFFTGLRGYRASYVTALNNGVYGIYAFDAVDGLLEHSYAAGSPDAGFYIGQCNPCMGIIDDVVAEWNGLGYSGTNASDVTIVNSVWRHNVGGIVPNTLDTELLPPFEDVRIVGNLVHDNDNREAPALAGAWGSLGAGITLAGGNDSLVARNHVVNHERTGIFVTPNLSVRFWMSGGNEIRDNVVDASGLADITFSGVAAPGNCFSGNNVTTTMPPALQALHGCQGLRLPMGYDVGQMMASLGTVAEASDAAAAREDAWRTAPAPAAADQPDMPPDTPVDPAVDVAARHGVDLATITVPDLPPDLAATRTRTPTMAGIPLLGSAFSVFYGLYGYILPFALYAAWVGLAVWDVARREDLGTGTAVAWILAVLVLPFVGPVLYLFAGRSRLPLHVRLAVVLGGVAAYAVTLGVGALAGGIV
jgi:plastocyanin